MLHPLTLKLTELTGCLAEVEKDRIIREYLTERKEWLKKQAKATLYPPSSVDNNEIWIEYYDVDQAFELQPKADEQLEKPKLPEKLGLKKYTEMPVEGQPQIRCAIVDLIDAVNKIIGYLARKE